MQSKAYIPFRPQRRLAGFTLIELMVSIALVVLLLAGINAIFKMSSDAVGTGQQLSAMTRDNRSARVVMEEDAKRWASDGPLFVIMNTTDASGRRRDILAFCARGEFRRNTADDGSFVSDITSNEAWIWYGHLNVPNPSATGVVPSDTLGRMAILLKPRDLLFASGAPVTDHVLRRTANFSEMATIAKGCEDTTGNWQIEQSRYDLAGTTLTQLRQDLGTAAIAGVGNKPAFDTWLANSFAYNFECDPFISRPMTSQVIARAMPQFVQSCSEFIVEFAGDYVKQDSNGEVATIGPDGVIDYIFAPATGKRAIRWYGLPRDLDDDAQVNGFSSGRKNYDMAEVVPLYEILHSKASNTFADFERKHPAQSASYSLPRPDTEKYTCIWLNDAPRLVRVHIKVEDPAGRLADGQWFEYVLGPQ